MSGSPPQKLKPDQGKTCRKIKVPTDDEIFALNKMREIRNMIHMIKSRLLESDIDTDMKSELEDRISALKMEWKLWEEKKDLAAKERMIILGHENRE